MKREPLNLGERLWNLLLYPLAYLGVGGTTTAVELTVGGVYPSAYEAYPLQVLGTFYGLVLWGFPAFAVSLVSVAIAFRLGRPRVHRPLAVVVPTAVHAVYLAWLQPIYFRSWLGIVLTLLPFVALGVATFIPRERAVATESGQ